MIKNIQTDTFEARLYCDKCGKEMHHAGVMLPVSPPKYPHHCECGNIEQSLKIYPCINYMIRGVNPKKVEISDD